MSSTRSPRVWAIFLLVVAVGVLDLLSTTVADVAAPTIMRDPLLLTPAQHAR